MGFQGQYRYFGTETADTKKLSIFSGCFTREWENLHNRDYEKSTSKTNGIKLQMQNRSLIFSDLL